MSSESNFCASVCVWSLQIRALTSSFAASSSVHKKTSCPPSFTFTVPIISPQSSTNQGKLHPPPLKYIISYSLIRNLNKRNLLSLNWLFWHHFQRFSFLFSNAGCWQQEATRQCCKVMCSHKLNIIHYYVSLLSFNIMSSLVTAKRPDLSWTEGQL